MVDWNSPAEIQREAIAIVNLCHALLGVYAWEFLFTLNFDWQLITRERKFKWPMVFYLGARYFSLIELVLLIVSENITTQAVNCTALWVFIRLMGDMTVGCSTLCLAFRAIAVWERRRWVVVLVTVLAIGHWALIIVIPARTVGLNVGPGVGCVAIDQRYALDAALFVFSVAFDAIILVLLLIRIAFRDGVATPLVSLLVSDGAGYFVVTLLLNMLSVVFVLLNLNPILANIFLTPASVFTTIAATRAVRRLTNFFGNGSTHYSSESGPLSSRRTITWKREPPPPPRSTHATLDSGTVVKMATFPSSQDMPYDQSSENGINLKARELSEDA